MRAERPTILDLVKAVRTFLDEEVRPELDHRLAFHTRVAANALGIIARELEQGAQLQSAELEGLRRLFDPKGRSRNSDGEASDDAGRVAELNRQLSRRICRGELGLHTPGLLGHLRTVADAKLAIDNPKYRPVEEEG